MSYEDRLRELSQKASEQQDRLSTEEAVKMAIVSPFFHILEYDPFDPEEIIPEYTADVGIKRGEKVDYAIALNKKIEVVVECKSPNSDLALKHASQLYRYFSVTNARFAILTNGFDWNIYTDLDAPNKMDERPFLSFNILHLTPSTIAELGKFRKSVFDTDKILKTAEDLKYISALKTEFSSELGNPSDDFVSMLAKRVCPGRRLTAPVIEEFRSLVKRSANDVLRDKVNARLSSALQQNIQDSTETNDPEDTDEIETTEIEWDGFRIAVAIASKVIDPDRVVIRDQKSYCAILVDNNNRRPLVRLWFNSPTTKYLGLFDGEVEEKVLIERPVDLYKHEARIRATAEKYLP